MSKTIYWIGGSPCSGKSSIAEILTERYGLVYYKLDDPMQGHMEEAIRDGKPHSAANLAMDMEGMWMRDPQLQFEEEIAIYDEIFPYSQRDIAAMGEERPILAEGAGFMPHLMAQKDVAKDRYVCIVPTEAFQRENYAKREWIGLFLEGCTDPAKAFDNWMSRDALFAREMRARAQKLGYETILVDGGKGIEENCARVAETFGLA